jgi:hypothetical protein
MCILLRNLRGFTGWPPEWRACSGQPLQAIHRVSFMKRPFLVPMQRRIAVALAAACCTAPCLAAGKDCEQLLAEVARRYEAGGIAAPDLQLLPGSAATNGKVVGSCELGTRKLVYGGAKGTPPSPASSPARAAKPAGTGAPVLTECKDGTVSMGGSCKGK